MAVVDVRIAMVNGEFVPSMDIVRLSKSKGDTVKWHNDTVESIQINFTSGSPFAAHFDAYDIGAGKQSDSGAVKADQGTSWSYTITAASGAMADPQVIIER